jgi:cyanophycinase
MFSEFFEKRSYLIIIGGAEDKESRKVVLTRVVEVTKANNIVVIPTASGYPQDVFANYLQTFKALGVTNIQCCDIRYPEEADKEEHLNKIKEADLVFFSGGDQSKLVQTLGKSTLLQTINTRFYNGELCIAGTSAGAAASGEMMFFDGDYKGFLKGSIHVDKGFGFIKEIAVDTHFLHRERIPRLLQFLANGYCTKGIGLDEDTAMIIAPDMTAEVIGNGMVTLLSTDKVTFNDLNQTENGQTFNINNVRLGFLSSGATFNLKKWAVAKPRNIEQAYKEILTTDIISPGAYI